MQITVANHSMITQKKCKLDIQIFMRDSINTVHVRLIALTGVRSTIVNKGAIALGVFQ